MAGAALKVSVLADGGVLIDGNPASSTELEDAMRAAVWSYRESAHAKAPPAALKLMQFIKDWPLPFRLSSKLDFSDTVLPEVASGWAPVFAVVRERAARPQTRHLRWR